MKIIHHKEHGDGKLSTREVAKSQGFRFYEGRRCDKCGQAKRYTSCGACVNCHKGRTREPVANHYLNQGVSMDEAHENRVKAEADNRASYRGRPCKHGHTLRYVKDGSCLECRVGSLKLLGTRIRTRPGTGDPGTSERYRGVFFKDRELAKQAGDAMYIAVGGGCLYHAAVAHGIRFTGTNDCVECRMEAELEPDQLEFARLEPWIWAQGSADRLRQYIDVNHTRKEVHDRRHHLQLQGSRTRNPDQAGVRGVKVNRE